MPRLRFLLSILALASLVSLPAFAAQPVHPSRSKLQPCKARRDGGEVEALCGQYQVWENRAAKAGRKITLKVLVLPALGPNPKPDPIVALGGGPGQAASALTGMMSTAARQDRDFLFVDQRGTGEPDRLQCLLGTPGDFQSLFNQLFPLDAVRRCREELGRKYDLTLYTTAAGADDLDEVRAWLGYGKLNLAGYSYGTRMAQVYLKRHPESVRTVTLWGSVPMDEALPISHSAGGQRSLDLVFELCEQEAACRAKFPVRKDFQAVMARLDAGPVEVEVPHPETGKPTRVRLPREVVNEALRTILYSAEEFTALPLALHEAAAGDWKHLGEWVVQQRYGSLTGLAQGLFFSVTCAEDMPHITAEMIAARTAGSFLRDDRVRRQKAACDLWPRARLEPGYREAARSDLPVLAINGRLDPVTPPDFGRRTVASYPNSLFLEVPYEGHAISGDCPVRIAETFIDRGSLQGLDTSCLAQTKPVPFLLEPPKEEIKPFG
jgi:pimeloyl-ACP methyl ester carboxylesterase